jgi:macrolide transport system ATP-binding/permease protein
VLGANRLTVFPNVREFPGARLPLDDVSAVLRHVRDVDSVLPETNAEATVRHGNVDYTTRITATAADYPRIRDWRVATGMFFDDRDSETYSTVAVLGDTARVNLFPYGDDPLGRYILVNRVPFLVIGTMARKGGASGGDEDDVIFVPFKTGASRLFGQPDLRVLTATVADVARMGTAEADLRALLTKRHGREDFQILNSIQMQQSMEEAMSIATLVLGAVGAISLLVGGIGVMNIMLVSVAERTREIGIRMATGARRSDILVQFLSEAVVVSVLGGLVGVALGIAAGSSIALFAPDVWVSFTWASMTTAFGCAAAIGLLFGYAPARRASRLDPVAALASE